MHNLYLFLFLPCVFPPSAVFPLMLSLSAGLLYRLAIKSPIFAADHFSLSQHSPPPPPLYLIISSEKANDPLRERGREGSIDGERCSLSCPHKKVNSGLKRKATKKISDKRKKNILEQEERTRWKQRKSAPWGKSSEGARLFECGKGQSDKKERNTEGGCVQIGVNRPWYYVVNALFLETSHNLISCI